MRKSIRIEALFMALFAFCIFCCGPLCSSANAVVIVDDALVALVIAALAAFGITFTYTGGYYTLYDWVAQMIAESGASFTGCKIGVNTLSNLLLNNKFVRELQIVASYIVLTYSLSSNSDVQILTSQIGCYDEISGQMYYPGTYTSKNVFEPGTTILSFYVNNRLGETNEKLVRFDGVWYRITVTHESSNSAKLQVFSSTDGIEFTLVNNSTNSMANSTAEWKVCLYEENGSVWLYMDTHSNIAYVHPLVELADVSTGEDLIANCGVLDIPSDLEIGDNYGILALPVPWGESYQIILDSIPTLSDQDLLEGNTTLTLDSEEIVESQIDTDLTSDDYVSADPSDYESPGLEDVFPFCIPFDLYNFVECLASDPVAPSFEWRFYVPDIVDETIEIDLSPYDTVAQLLRTMELLLFCVGLAFVTRKLIRG